MRSRENGECTRNLRPGLATFSRRTRFSRYLEHVAVVSAAQKFEMQSIRRSQGPRKIESNASMEILSVITMAINDKMTNKLQRQSIVSLISLD